MRRGGGSVMKKRRGSPLREGWGEKKFSHLFAVFPRLLRPPSGFSSADGAYASVRGGACAHVVISEFVGGDSAVLFVHIPPLVGAFGQCGDVDRERNTILLHFARKDIILRLCVTVSMCMPSLGLGARTQDTTFVVWRLASWRGLAICL